MNYSIDISVSAAKEIKALPKGEIRKVIQRIEALAVNPRPVGCKKLKSMSEELWRIRSGNYRIIYSIDDAIKIVDVRNVGNRKDIYK